MSTGEIRKRTFQIAAGCAAGDSPQFVYCGLQSKPHLEIGAAKSSFAFYEDPRWLSTTLTPAWNVVAMVSVSIGSGRWLVAGLGDGGQIWEFETATMRESVHQLPRSFGVTNLGAFDGAVLACGMGRVVLLRQTDQTWTDISAPAPSLDDDSIVGFTDVVEHPKLGIVAVGWQGEVWTSPSGSVWHQVDTPTNANLNAVDVAADGTIYCVGDKGSILKGKDGLWETVASGTLSTLQDVCCHQEHVYVATDFSVLRLTDQGLVPDATFDDEDFPSTCLKLFVVAGVGMCSLASNDIFLRRDGAWSRIA